jgi:ribosomal protein S18 acetylase RimI-like enzyme
MISITQLQEYLHHIAQQQYEAVKVPYFTLYFHPTETLTFFNYGIPDVTTIESVGAILTTVRAEFAKRNRRARFECLEEFNPQLGTLLSQNGFHEESRQYLMVCSVETYASNANVANFVIEEITENSEVSAAQQFLTIQSRGFGGDETEVASAESAQQFLRMLGQGRAYVGLLAGKPVAVGVVTAPYKGICELAGLATLAAYRRQGIATAITSKAVEQAFEHGAEVIFLTAADERAGSVYQKVGFENYTTVVAYIDHDNNCD